MDILGETICPYCGVGCRLRLEGTAERIGRIRGVETAPANLGRLCAKGAQLAPTIHTPDRLSSPLVRLRRTDAFQLADWDTALSHIAAIFTDILHSHGPDAVAFYGSGQLDSETTYLATKLFKGSLGCNNTDSNSRLCMAAAAAGYRGSLGSDGPPCCYDDIDLADVILIIGSNMAEAHPVTFDRLRASKNARPEQKIIVVDPRRTATAEAADLHLAVAPGSDIALLTALGRILLLHAHAADHSFIAQHASGFEDYRRFLLRQDLSELCAATGLAEAKVFQLARWIAGAKGFLSFYCMGLNQSTVGMWKNNSLINLHLLTGQIGKPGAGPFSLTGQPNAMGGRETGLLSHQLPGYRVVEDAEQRRVVEQFWGRRPGTIRPQAGLTAVEMFRALEKGQLKAIWIAATNPAVSLPDLHHVRRALGRARLLVVQDAYHPTETTRLADVVLPAAQWGEKEWTSTNCERMVSFSPKLFDAPGQALPDWEILARFGQKLGLEGFHYASRDAVWDEFIQLTAGRPCDMAGMTSARLRQVGSLQWPCPTADHPGSKRRYLDRRFATPDGKARFIVCEHREPRELPDHEFPFVLTTGRVYAHWHTLTRTAKADKLVRREPRPYIEVNPSDAEKLGVKANDLVQISSRRGTVQLPARISAAVKSGMVFVPFHWGDLFGEGNAANYLTISAIGRVAKQPEFKFCAVALEKAPAQLTKERDGADEIRHVIRLNV
ncbi:MAG TPA: nitrate reductase [Gemmataceae bacterium]|nr:nitrate reductase [Gemmataceae bacterium]